jgi:hypothetical protein
MSNRGPASILIVLAVALCGCGGIEQAIQQQDLQVARQSCASSGLADGTPQFAQCVETQLSLIADERQRALEWAPPPPRMELDSGQLCLPTAAGPSFTC